MVCRDISLFTRLTCFIQDSWCMHCSWLVDSLAGVGPLKPEHESNIISRKGGLNRTEQVIRKIKIKIREAYYPKNLEETNNYGYLNKQKCCECVWLNYIPVSCVYSRPWIIQTPLAKQIFPHVR